VNIQKYAGVTRAGGVLRFGGGAGNDVVVVSGGNLVVNGVPYSLTGVTEVRTWARNGNDQIDLTGLSVQSYIDGGQGNDNLTGGSGDDVILGGAGIDTITGASGNDFLVGGAGVDRIVGSAGHDVLVAGDIGCDLNLAALRAVSQAWAASRTVVAEAVDDFLDESVFADDAVDQLTGGAGADLFIIETSDTVTDFQFGKPQTNKDGDVVIRNGVAAV
jgi:Ca2+-binding RTX toxin-like protein